MQNKKCIHLYVRFLDSIMCVYIETVLILLANFFFNTQFNFMERFSNFPSINTNFVRLLFAYTFLYVICSQRVFEFNSKLRPFISTTSL